MVRVKIRRVGNSLGATFPKELLDALNVEEGDRKSVVQGKSVDLGGRRIIKKKKKKTQNKKSTTTTTTATTTTKQQSYTV